MQVDHWRQLDFYKPTNNHRVLVIGAGSIGSYVVFGLARMGVKHITVVDHDTVANHNLPNQFFTEDGLPTEENTLFKVIALQKTISLIMPKVNITVIPKKIEECIEEVCGYNYNAIFTLVDDMNVRKWIWTYVKANGRFNYLIDARIGGEYSNILSINTRIQHDKEYYESTLWSNEESAPLPCTGTAVIDVTFEVAGACIGRFRQAMAEKLQVLHTFHSHNIGSSALMAYKRIPDNAERTAEFIQTVGTIPNPAEVR